MPFIKTSLNLAFDLKSFERSNAEEAAQRVAWRIVRSVSDSMGKANGSARLLKAVEQMRAEYPDMPAQMVEDHIRAAYVNFKNETPAT